MKLVLFLAAAGGLWAQDPPVQPSANAGRTGSYEAHTSRPGYDYWVYVPRSYTPENPAGLHLFFHGQRGQASARNFGRWARHLLEPFNLIGINMEYEDGDNTADTEGKLKAAREAVAQVLADYKVVPGRGVISSFSGGGVPHGLFYERHAGAPRDKEWPFCMAALYGSNYWQPPRHQKTSPMAWFVAVGHKEWTLARLGESNTQLMAALLGEASRGSCPDLYFKVLPEKGHTIADEDVAEAARVFRRTDLATAPFLWAGDFPEPELRKAVEAANALALGKAEELAAKVPEKVRARAEALRAKIRARILAGRELEEEESAQAIGRLKEDLRAAFIESGEIGFDKIADYA
ncbi:MAG: hypothetical protein ACK44W_16425, partial [Planctomycetota bacterium]